MEVWELGFKIILRKLMIGCRKTNFCSIEIAPKRVIFHLLIFNSIFISVYPKLVVLLPSKSIPWQPMNIIQFDQGT